MKKNIRVALLLVAVLSVSAGKAFAGNNRTYFCYRLIHDPVLDGRVAGDPAWEVIPQATGFLTTGSLNYASKQTRFKMGYTSEALFLGIECQEPEIDMVVARLGDKNGSIWAEDSVTIFLKPEKLEDYFGFFINAKGSRFNAVGWGGKLPPEDDYNWQAVAYRGADYWSLEVRIPFSLLKEVPRNGEVWKGNINREVITSGEETTWAYLAGGAYHDLAHFAGIVFQSKTPTPGEKSAIEARMERQQDVLRAKVQGRMQSCLDQAAGILKTLTEECRAFPGQSELVSAAGEELSLLRRRMADRKSPDMKESYSLYLRSRDLLKKCGRLESKIILQRLAAPEESVQSKKKLHTGSAGRTMSRLTADSTKPAGGASHFWNSGIWWMAQNL